MRKFPHNFFILLVLSFTVGNLFADLPVIVASESDLPFELSPSKFSNSSSKFSNSVSKFSNSSSKFSNTASKFDNSPSNYNNGKNGNRRLLLVQDESQLYIGYYVPSEDGIINFFSPAGKRLFYSPPETDALFSDENGDFSGTLASLKGENVLVVTEKGQISFLQEGISLSNQAPSKQNTNTGLYPGGSSGHWIRKNIDSGSMIILEDGSLWKIDPLDKIDAMLWLPITSITIIMSNDGSVGYDYLLINTDDGEKAHAKYLGKE